MILVFIRVSETEKPKLAGFCRCSWRPFPLNVRLAFLASLFKLTAFVAMASRFEDRGLISILFTDQVTMANAVKLPLCQYPNLIALIASERKQLNSLGSL